MPPIVIPFPRLKFAQENNLQQQIEHIKSELLEVDQAYLNEPIIRVAEELGDLATSCITALDIICRQHGLSPQEVFSMLRKKNRSRGYELTLSVQR